MSKHLLIHCAVCGKPKLIDPFFKRPQNFCNRTCMGVYYTKRITVNCAHCGKSKEIKQSDKREHNFCDQRCMGMYERNRHALICPTCGIEFVTRKGVRRKYCSDKCKYDAISENYVGFGNPAHGRKSRHETPSAIGRRGHYGLRWRRLSNAIRDRDGHKCQHCGMTERANGRLLDVHHIRPVRSFKNDMDAANDPCNLISLCRKCHRKAEAGKIMLQLRMF